ncbi:MAG: hypothetical protein ACYDBB_22000 [Armatimonadota bacterium]
MQLMRLLMLVVGLLLTVPGWTMMIAVPEGELVGTSDLIVVATVTKTERLAGEQGWLAGVATLKIEQTLKGPRLPSVVIRYTVVPDMPEGVIIMDHGGMELTVGQQQIFFLYREQRGYLITGGIQGVRGVEETQRFQNMVNELGLTVSLVQPVGPLYFGQPTAVGVKIVNKGKVAVQVNHIQLTGFFLSARMEGGLPITLAAPLAPPRTGMAGQNQKPEEILPIVQPGAEVIVMVKIVCATPITWRMLDPDSYLQAPAMLRARVQVDRRLLVELAPATLNAPVQALPAVQNRTLLPIPQFSNTVSDWVTIMVGYPLPADATK